MKNYTFEYNSIMFETMIHAHDRNFVKGKVRVPVGVNPTDLKKDISIFFVNVSKRGEWISYNTPRK